MSKTKRYPDEVEDWEVSNIDYRQHYLMTIKQPSGGKVTIRGLVTFGHRRYINPNKRGKDYIELCVAVRGERISDGKPFNDHFSLADFTQFVEIDCGWKTKTK